MSDAKDLQNQLLPYFQAMMKSSGLSPFDAQTSVLYALATYLDFDELPLLVFQGAAGTGKSCAMKQLFPMCKGAKWIQGKTYATQRDELHNIRTAFLEEADKMSTRLYTWRFSKQTGTVSANVGLGQGSFAKKGIDVFGATVLHRRTPIADVGLRSRSIVIKTKYQKGSYETTHMGDLSAIAKDLKVTSPFGQDRVWQTWSPLLNVAIQLEMVDWVVEARQVIDTETKNLKGGQGYEPSQAVLQAIDIESRKGEKNNKRQDKTVKMQELRKTLSEVFGLTLHDNQIAEEAQSMGFSTTKVHGYPAVKVTKELLDKLLPE